MQRTFSRATRIAVIKLGAIFKASNECLLYSLIYLKNAYDFRDTLNIGIF